MRGGRHVGGLWTADFRRSGRLPSTPIARGVAAAALFLAPFAASAQLTTDQVPLGRTLPADQEIRDEFDRSRLRLGPVRLLPWIGIQNFGYNNNIDGTVTNPTGDFTASVGAGARFYLPIGAKTFLRVDALPSYTWYKDSTERDGWGGRGEVAYLAFFNRLSLRLSGAYTLNKNSILTSEVPAVVTRTGWDGKADVEVDVTRRISLFGGIEVLRERIEDPTGDLAVDVANYDRTDGVSRAGVRYNFSEGWNVSIAAEGTRTRFVQAPEERNNWGWAPLFGLHYSRPRFFVNLFAGYRSGRPLDGSAFPEFETPTGSAFASVILTRYLELQAFGSRRLVYGSSAQVPYYLQNRFGGGLVLRISPVELGAYGSYGNDDYSLPTKGSGLPAREDRITTLYGTLAVVLGRNVTLTARATDTRYETKGSGATRSVFIFLTGLSFGLELAR